MMIENDTTIIILGATGDLARRKLVPALFTLHCKKELPERLRVLGLALEPYSDDKFRELIWEGAQEFSDLAVRTEQWRSFAQRLFYVGGDLTIPEDFSRLRERLEELERDRPSAHRLFYLSIMPQLFEPAINNIGALGLAREDAGWRRVVIEKPFGSDLASARALNRTVRQVFDERQVFRIDHYLGKETVQNLLVLRFANAMFEPLWNYNYVDNVQITVAEEVGVEYRAAYYDQIGVVRDMVQNHLLQLLTMIAMEPPTAADAESLRDKKVEVLKAIRHWNPEEATRHSVPGQYRGYLDEEGVAAGSTTATYVALRLYIDNWRWPGVPFYLRTGKAMAGKLSEITIQFKYPPHTIFSLGPCENLSSNVLALCLQPDEGLHLAFDAKVPGKGMCMQPVEMDFHYEDAFKGQGIPQAYEHLLVDALEGNAQLFIRSDWIEEAWRIVDPLLQPVEEPAGPSLHIYEPGSWGPDAATGLLAEDGRSWLIACGRHLDAHA